MQAVVDRIEGNIVVIEYNNKMYNVDISKVNGQVLEGDIVDIVMENDEIISVCTNNKKTTERKKYIDELVKNMWKD